MGSENLLWRHTLGLADSGSMGLVANTTVHIVGTKSIISYHPQDLFLWSLCHDICEIGGSPLGDMKLNVLVGHSGQQFLWQNRRKGYSYKQFQVY